MGARVAVGTRAGAETDPNAQRRGRASLWPAATARTRRPDGPGWNRGLGRLRLPFWLELVFFSIRTIYTLDMCPCVATRAKK
jgi:hypothetical protein